MNRCYYGNLSTIVTMVLAAPLVAPLRLPEPAAGRATPGPAVTGTFRDEVYSA